MSCWALPGVGPSGRSELSVPGSVQKDTEKDWTDLELQLNHLDEPVENLAPGPPRPVGSASPGLALGHRLSRELPEEADACHSLWSWAKPPPTPHPTALELRQLWHKGTYAALTEGNLACPRQALGPRVPTPRQMLQVPGPCLRALELGCSAFCHLPLGICL